MLFGFDFTYRGNHNQLLAEALGISPGLDRLVEVPGGTVINYEPSITLALDEECRTQVRLKHRDADQRLSNPHGRIH